MPYPVGGKADKYGNRYEFKWVVDQLLRVIDETIDSVVIEEIGEEEEGVDLWINEKDGSREAQQCKGRNASKECWDISSLKSRGILKKSKAQLERSARHKFSLVSPLVCTLFQDLASLARNTSRNAKDFLNFQIEGTSGKELRELFDRYCGELELNKNDDNDLIRIVDFLSRTYYHQTPDSKVQKEYVIEKIKRLFIGNPNEIYNLLVVYILEEDTFSKEITYQMLLNYLSDNSIILRNLANDNRIHPKIDELNREYKNVFIPILGKLYERTEFDKCRKAIRAGNTLVIHGHAGSGKSGCTQSVIDFCEKNIMPYIAIKLDKRIPNGSSENFSHELGLPASIVYCLDQISKHKNAVLILDQLDALRWTQNHSRSALDVCSEIIREVENINRERDYKISLILACRTYDLENDNNIKRLFIPKNKSINDTDVEKIAIGELDEEVVKDIVGSTYEKLSGKLKKVLRTPSSLYIWEHLDKSKDYNEFSTANQLLEAWWKELSSKCHINEIAETEIIDLKNQMITKLENNKISFVNIKLLECTYSSLEFLVSNGMLLNNNGNISFVHQSMRDYFLFEKMYQRFFSGESITDIIGNREKQIPTKRYQVQMLLQSIIEYDIDIFMDAGEQILKSDTIRFYMKYVFLEVLGQCSELTKSIKKFIKTYIGDDKYREHIIENVVNGHLIFIELLIDEGYIDKWFHEGETNKVLAIRLLTSVSQYNSIKLVNIIRKYAFVSKADDDKLFGCFYYNIANESDEMFILRMKFYEHYPEFINTHLYIREMFKNNEEKAIAVVELMLKLEVKNKDKNIHRYEGEVLNECSEVIIQKGKEVINRLLPFVPLFSDYREVYLNDWSGKYLYNMGIERTCMSILKKAIIVVVKQNPLWFWQRFEQYLDKGYLLLNELILCGLKQMPDEYSDKVIEYLCVDTNKNVFDITSDKEDELGSVIEIIKKHSVNCSLKNFRILEEKLYYFHEENEKELFKRRLEYNRSNEYGHIMYWAFWGEVQGRLLPALQQERALKKTKELIAVLERKFNGKYVRHKNSHGHSGSVFSPISGKENIIQNNQWKIILTNKKLEHRDRSRYIEVKGGFVSNSIEEFSESFRTAVSKEPERFVNLVLSIDEKINELYIDSMFSGLAFKDKNTDLPLELLETILLKYKCDNISYRASYICNIIKNRKNTKWSKGIIDVLKNIAINHKNPELGKVNVSSTEDKEMKSFDMLYSNSINCVRGAAAITIATLLWNDSGLFLEFKSVVDKLTKDINPAVKMAAIECLHAIYNIDREWVSEKIIMLFRKDFRIVGHPYSKQFLFLLYPKYRQDVLEIIWECYCFNDEKMVKVGACCLSEMYILYNEFSQKIIDVESMDENQTKGIIEMAILYFDKDKYNKKAKNLLELFFSSNKDLEDPFTRLFYDNRINFDRDLDFLLAMMQSKLNGRTIHAFVRYLEENAKSVMDFSTIIIAMSKSILLNDSSKSQNHPYWGIGDELSKLIAVLYDEVLQVDDIESRNISQQCLDIWDLMFEKRFGSIRSLSRQILER